MTTAYWCVLIAGILPYVATITAKLGARFDNARPREWLAGQTGYRSRANAAQLNGFEAFPLFAAGVIVAHLAGAPQARIDLLAVVFVVARVAYLGCYLADLATLRTVVWLVGFASVIALFLAA